MNHIQLKCFFIVLIAILQVALVQTCEDDLEKITEFNAWLKVNNIDSSHVEIGCIDGVRGVLAATDLEVGTIYFYY
jgi:hypothetical protein